MYSSLETYFPDITKKQLAQFDKLVYLFKEWNTKINLISRKDTDHLYEKHILHSLSIAKHFNFGIGTNIIDIGTGGGFPGIPLAIMFPDANFDLVDSIGKKIVAVKNISQELGLTNVRAIKARAETLPAKYDFVISRAVTAFPAFVNISSKLFRKNQNNTNSGIIYLKGGDFHDEIANFAKIKVYNISEIFKTEFFETKKIIFLPINFNGNTY
ncbi:MAG: 16S rRNA (guanine(527)-N(7))-methyltransferase RsmG [Bacteroidales bacterium]|nr:16S rRNA (guanine(527)-N(7))-methyltransferase RsmG [Bacteroidales bacterium]